MSELIYTDTSRIIPGIPGRDLTADEVELYGNRLIELMSTKEKRAWSGELTAGAVLLATGIYSKPGKKKPADKDGK